MPNLVVYSCPIELKALFFVRWHRESNHGHVLKDSIDIVTEELVGWEKPFRQWLIMYNQLHVVTLICGADNIPSRRRFDFRSTSDLECPQDLIASSTKYGIGYGGLPNPTTLQISSFHQVLLKVLNERHFGFHIRKFAGRDIAVLIHTFNIHILHYRHRTCLFGHKPPLLSSRPYTGKIFYRVLQQGRR